MLFLFFGYFACVTFASQIEYVSVMPEQDNQLFILDLFCIQTAAITATNFESEEVQRKVYIASRIEETSKVLPLTRITFDKEISTDIPSFQLVEENDNEVFYVSKHLSYKTFGINMLGPELVHLRHTKEMPFKIPEFRIDMNLFYSLRNVHFAEGLTNFYYLQAPPNHPLHSVKKKLKRLKNYHHDKWPIDSIPFSMGYAAIHHSIISTFKVQDSIREFQKYWPKSVLKCFVFSKNAEVYLVHHMLSYIPAWSPIALFWDPKYIAPIQMIELSRPSMLVQFITKKYSFLWLLAFSPEQPDAEGCRTLIIPSHIRESFPLNNADII